LSSDINQVIAIFAEVGKEAFEISEYVSENIYPMTKQRIGILSHEVFNKYHSETSMMRYIKKIRT
jgi:glycine dehydrogenase